MAAVHYLKASQRVVPKPLPQKGMIVPFQSKRVSATKAKVLTKEMYEALLEFVRMGKYPLRDTALVMLSCNVGLRAQEIAGLRWDTVGDARGSGPRWHPFDAYPSGFAARHLPGL